MGRKRKKNGQESVNIIRVGSYKGKGLYQHRTKRRKARK